ncbi:MAG: hypothetical protein SGILL_002638 [Bacillariaceae sp.]
MKTPLFAPSLVAAAATLVSGFHQPTLLFASASDKDIGPGMEDAFRQLEQLESLDTTLGNDDASSSNTSQEEREKKKRDTAFAKAMKELDLKDIVADAPVSVESEAELYKDMAEELSMAESEEDLKKDLTMDLEDVVAVAVEPSIDTSNEEFVNKAIDEALRDAKEQNADVVEDKEAFLDNKEIMSEIEKIFDRANDQLMEGLEEIRTEQMELARESAERNSKEAEARIAEDEQRLAMADENMKKMLARVNKETQNVEDAIEDLKRAQIESEGAIDGQLSNLKSGGLVKQATLAGALLFTLRAGVDTIGFVGGDPSHAFPALLQGALAIVCIIAFIAL